MRDDVTELLTRLENSMQRMTWALMDCDEDDLRMEMEDGEWSPMQIFSHIKASDDIMTARLPLFVTHDRPTLQSVDERAWAVAAGYEDAPLDQTLMALRRHRDEMLWQLRRLPDDAWDRVAHHEQSGDITLLDQIRKLAEHEEEHVVQLESLFGDEDEEGDQVEAISGGETDEEE